MIFCIFSKKSNRYIFNIHIHNICTYMYINSEDKYTFARIISNDTLVFDSHFEVSQIIMIYL